MCSPTLCFFLAVFSLPAAESISREVLVRLRTPIASNAPAGSRFEATVTGCAKGDCASFLPQGSTITGHVRKTNSVGFGLKRERASVELEFDGCMLPNGEMLECHSRLLSVDNARETVTRENHIQGILAANHPHSLLGGMWYRPTSALFPRSAVGITGAGRMIYTKMAPNLYTAGILIAARLIFLRLPDPEVRLPSGSELILRVTALAAPDHGVQSVAHTYVNESMVNWAQHLPVEVTQPDHSVASDIINLAFSGSRDDLNEAFLSAGWATAEPLNARTFRHVYSAFSSMQSYPNAPVSPLRYQGRLPDLVFQKSFNSLAKRHHIRLWAADSPEGPIWLGAATHDVGLTFDWKRLIMTHRIDREIDLEREKVVSDLSFAGCLVRTARIERPALASNKPRVMTDGALLLVEPQTCHHPQLSMAAPQAGPRVSLVKAGVRRTVLEARHYLLRSNGYYWAYRGLRSKQVLGRLVPPKGAELASKPDSAVLKRCWRCGSGSNRRMRVLQTLALPLGYRTPN